jgi:hypothetical protein
MNERNDRRETYDALDNDQSSPIDRPMTVAIALGVFAVFIAALLLIM